MYLSSLLRGILTSNVGEVPASYVCPLVKGRTLPSAELGVNPLGTSESFFPSVKPQSNPLGRTGLAAYPAQPKIIRYVRQGAFCKTLIISTFIFTFCLT